MCSIPNFSNEGNYFDPFLWVDEFKDKVPDHIHAGYVTYVIKGSIHFWDICGYKGKIAAGDVQWITTAGGMIHCELPHGEGEVYGLHLWVNLAKKYKLMETAYQELLDKDIPRTTKDGVTVKVIAGESFGIKSKVYTRTPTMYLDLKLSPGSKLEQLIPVGWTTFLYILSGKAECGNQEIEAQHTVTFKDNGDSVCVKNSG